MKAISEYLKHKPCLRDQVLDRGELKRVASACGLSPQQARIELKELGYVLTQNHHGMTIWKRAEEALAEKGQITRLLSSRNRPRGWQSKRD